MNYSKTVICLAYFIIFLSLPINTYATDSEANYQETSNRSIRNQEAKFEPLIERYILDQLVQLREEINQHKVHTAREILDREHQSVDRAVAYATDSITYFFYLIAGTSSLLVIVGWTSIRDIKDRVHALADKEISKVIQEYEKRLASLEKSLKQKTKHIEENREEIELTQEIQSLWLRAGQETSLANKIAIYDKILKLKPEDCEALTYKADAVLELDEPQWAVNLCQIALDIDPLNANAFYQLACAYTALNHFDDAVDCLQKAIVQMDSYRNAIEKDPALDALREYAPFLALFSEDDKSNE